jgi:hypothetical protein
MPALNGVGVFVSNPDETKVLIDARRKDRDDEKNVNEYGIKILTLIIMELVGVLSIDLVQELDDICVAVGTRETVPGAVEEQDDLLGLLGRLDHGRRAAARL